MTEEDAQALKSFRLMSNGMGGLDWAGLPLAVARYGVRDVAGLIDRLLIIKGHRAPREE
jgi:hypothetical protein